MDDDSKVNLLVKCGLGMLGLGAIAAAVTIPRIGIWVALAILLLALIFFGGYYLWRRMRLRRQQQALSSGVEQQAGAVPKTISDPRQRADLDALRRKFLDGLQVFKSRGKDIYKLPWFVIIGESGSGKSMAIRNSGIDFPPGMQDELQGSGGTINMDWWFTNRGIIVDTAGKMIIPDEAESDLRGEWKPQTEWIEFLRLLRRSRPHCPINGLLLVLSTESLIKDSADKIARKASRLAQQLDLIQRTLDVRFPVYLLVTKCDLMEGFREFSDNITDPLLQHQMFGWSNPDPLDAAFRPDLVEQFLNTVADRVRRRRLALLRESAAARGGETQTFFRSSFDPGRASAGRRVDDVNSVFALPASLMRLAPRLRRYLETIFVAGEWSAKPIFLRGIYFTSSMREGSALDEALALATNVSVDELPESGRSESRAFFLRDFFNEKVFREGGLVTRATNTLKMLRQRRLAIFGTATVLMLLLLGFAWFSYSSLRASVLQETKFWRAGATNWSSDKIWKSGAIVSAGAGADPLHYIYIGTNQVDETGLNAVEFHRALMKRAQQRLAVGFVFKPISWLSDVKERPDAQRLLFEDGVLRPLVEGTRNKIENRPPANDNPDNLRRYRDALLSLMWLEADRLANANGQNYISTTNAEKYLRSFVSYLTESDYTPDEGLEETLVADYSKGGAPWPPTSLLVAGGDHLANNPAIAKGLDAFRLANKANEVRIMAQVQRANDMVAALTSYAHFERDWLSKPDKPCAFANSDVYSNADMSRLAFLAVTNPVAGSNLASSYASLQQATEAASTSAFSDITANLQPEFRSKGIFLDITDRLKGFASESVRLVESNYVARSNAVVDLDQSYIAKSGLAKPAYLRRHVLYQMACDLTSQQVNIDDGLLGDKWKQFGKLRDAAQTLTTNLGAYDGPMADAVQAACGKIVNEAVAQLQGKFTKDYAKVALNKLSELKRITYTSFEQVTNSGAWLKRVDDDLNTKGDAQSQDLKPVADGLIEARQTILGAIDLYLRSKVGFPVFLNSSQAMSSAAVHDLKDFLNPLVGELQQGIWKAGNADTLAGMQSRCTAYGALAARLVNPKGETIYGTLYFVPGKTEADIGAIEKYRGLKVSIGNADGNWMDVAVKTDVTEIAKIPADAPLHLWRCLQLTQLDSAKDTKVCENWGLIRLLRDYHAVPTDDQTTWRFQIPIPDSPSPGGNANFQIKFENPLPKLQDWPTQ
jgi:IcmF-related N-terminal domain